MGSGKTTIGRKLAKEIGFYFLDTDSLIENYEGKEIVKIFATNGEEYFRKMEHLTFTWMKNSIINSVIATGGGFVNSIEDIKLLGKVILLDISFENILKRLNKEEIDKRPLIKDDFKLLFQSRTKLYNEVADIVIDTNYKDIDEIVKDIKEKL